jgi:transcription initiation factor TFIIB
VQDKLSMSLGTTRMAKILYRKFNEKKLTRGAVRTGVKANCIFYACRQTGFPRGAQEICDAFGIPTKDMSRTVNMFREVLLGEVQEKPMIISSKDVINRLLNGLNVYDGRFRMRCLRVCEELMKCVELMGKTPKGVASAVIYLMLDGNRTKQEVCAACDVSIPTLNKIVSIVKDKIKPKGQ